MTSTDHQQGLGQYLCPFAESQDHAMRISPVESWPAKADGGKAEHYGLIKSV